MSLFENISLDGRTDAELDALTDRDGAMYPPAIRDALALFNGISDSITVPFNMLNTREGATRQNVISGFKAAIGRNPEADGILSVKADRRSADHVVIIARYPVVEADTPDTDAS